MTKKYRAVPADEVIGKFPAARRARIKERALTRLKDMHEKWMCEVDYRREYAALEEEFARLEGQVARRIEPSVEADVLAKSESRRRLEKLCGD